MLDLHANVSEKMCALANGFTMYRENPHTDAKDAAMRATALLGRCLREAITPHMEWCRPPLVWAPPGTGTATNPMLVLKRRALALETERAEIWACNVAAGFSFADTPDTGESFSGGAVGPGTGATRRAFRQHRRWRARRRHGDSPRAPVAPRAPRAHCD